MPYIAVAYYTEKTPYEEEIKKLEKSLDRFHIPRDLVGIPNQGSWQLNTLYKPYFIKQMLIRHYPKDLLYIDADAIVQQHPALFDAVDFDIGIVCVSYTAGTTKGVQILSGTIYLANNAKVVELVERWIKKCFEKPTFWDQDLLHEALYFSTDLGLRVKSLPLTYAQIFDTMEKYGEPVIEQFQASRRFKEQVDTNLK